MWESLKNVAPETWARSAVLVLTFINQILAIFGKEALPILENDLYQLASLGATIIVGLYTAWKNNSFTPEAIAADAYMKQLKSDKKKKDA